MDFNINHYVHVKLTDLGRKLHKDRYDRLMDRLPASARNAVPYTAPEIDSDGFSKFQLWDLMQMFGPYVGLGCDLPMETMIRVPEGQE